MSTNNLFASSPGTGQTGSRKDILGLTSGKLSDEQTHGSWAAITGNLEQLERFGFEVLMADPFHWILRYRGALPEYHLYSTLELALFTERNVSAASQSMAPQLIRQQGTTEEHP
ncbi:hypothetical protein QVZ43_13670 [Marinobacter sp. chi1]|uniref:Uncharacterized protein n=1 Tax=Marinobacter suaedae TaxID=3057675 RepID=A0ABT8W3F2_9GAMM|nr:hypothetical protein [Marinobacter sp. chi1]MDO3722767.1 hypothetical protein [Marinobacter sp. chi1]